jgi:hypothetical protein
MKRGSTVYVEGIYAMDVSKSSTQTAMEYRPQLQRNLGRPRKQWK